MHGLQDTRTEWKNSQRLYDEAAASDKTIKVYPEARHQLLQDIPSVKAEVLRDIQDYLDAHI